MAASNSNNNWTPPGLRSFPNEAKEIRALYEKMTTRIKYDLCYKKTLGEITCIRFKELIEYYDEFFKELDPLECSEPTGLYTESIYDVCNNPITLTTTKI